MNIGNKILSKSNSYNFYKTMYENYKEKYESISKENDELKKKINELKDEYVKLKYNNSITLGHFDYNAESFCNKNFFNYAFRDDFPYKLNDFLKNFDEDSRNMAMYIFLRANAAFLLRSYTLFTDEELKHQEEYIEFVENNVSANEICGYKFTDQSFSKHCFVNDFLTEEDKEYIKNKDIIDAGAYIGDSSLAFSKLTSSNIHAFEPFEESYNKLIENIKLNNVKNVIPANFALTDKIGKEKIYLSGDNVQGITSDSSIRPYDKVFIVNTMTIDQYVKDNDLDVGFIKVDGEGAEQKLLKGAINTIKSQTPILILSIYHNPNDFFEIKPLIEKLDLEYNFKLSKERPWTFLADTVLECRPY